MFKFFKRRNKKRVGFETWDISTGAGFRVINNEDSIQYVNEDASKVIYFSVLLVSGSLVGDNIGSGEPKISEEDNGWQLKGVKKAEGQILVCIISLKDKNDIEWAKEFFNAIRYKGMYR